MDTSTPFALLRRSDRADVELLRGDITHVERLADIPLDGPVLALVPYRQVRELGYAAHDDGAPLACLIVTHRESLDLDDLLARLPAQPVTCVADGFDIDDEAYAALVKRVITDEIGRGEGANFVLRREFRATVTGDPVRAALAVFRRLLAEPGAYWTFVVHTGELTIVGATPERHVTVRDGVVTMNPISGTYRYPPGGPSADGALDFLADVKEIEELYMVVDEELKQMSAVCPRGGHISGPYLKEMGHLAHTEYLLTGASGLDVREVLRRTMFAATVTGSPVPNACRVIRDHEPTGRGYYGGALAYFEDARTLDSPILIRTVYIDPDGAARVPVGATLVRHSSPEAEVAETHTKAAAVLTALGTPLGAPRTGLAGISGSDRLGECPTTPHVRGLAEDPRVARALARRNHGLSEFWLRPQEPGALVDPRLAGRTALVVEAGDGWAAMLAHVLRSLGMAVTVRPWGDLPELGDYELVVPGPGPGDPRDRTNPKITILRTVIEARLTTGGALFAVCLGHQVLCDVLGLPLVAKPAPFQGTRRAIELFGRTELVGFYNTFAALAIPVSGVELAGDEEVAAVRGKGFAGVQFHPESILTTNGVAIARRLLTPLL